jgi:serine/threonine-protein kinase
MSTPEHEPEVHPPDMVGVDFLGKYELIAKLGRGGMADVFLAAAAGPHAFNKLVVVKRLRNCMAENDTYVRMFLDEAKISARLNHANIVQTYEVGDEDGNFFIIMEYLEGQPVNRIFARVFPQEPPPSGVKPRVERALWVRIIAEALSGLHSAHELVDYDGTPLSIVHRDLTPHNIFVTYDGVVKILDFGIAKAVLNTTQTETGVFKGKVNYTAPEQVTGYALDRRADIFSVGVTLWELLAGKRMRDGDAVNTLRELVKESPAPRLSSVVPDISPQLDEIVARATEHDPDKRYQTALEMRQALLGWFKTAAVDPSELDPGAMVSNLFADRRQRVREQIRAFLDRAPLPRSSNPRASQSSFSGRILPLLEDGSHSSHEGAVVTPTMQTLELSAASRVSRHKVLLAAAFVAVGAGIGLVAATRGSGDETTAQPAPAHATTGSLHIASEPSHAAIVIDGRPSGRTPLKTTVAPGQHTVVISMPGYVDAVLELTVTEGATIDQAIVLRPTPEASAEPSASSTSSARQTRRWTPRPRGSAPQPEKAPPAAPQPSRGGIQILEDDPPPPKVNVEIIQ